ncbi:DUF3035 domain-containing protein [Candidatus Pelagibacter bacterium]|nr:DUF3035 domain-containing protein [Candidatus Pelagibacter bacterium]
MKLFKLFLLITTIIILSSCGTLKEGFTSQKKNNSDEFLVEKKSPLVMPPDYNDLPVPKAENADEKKDNNEFKSLISKNKKEVSEDSNFDEDKDKSFEESLLKKIKNN